MKRTKQIVLFAALAVLMLCGVYVSVRMSQSEPTYDGTHTDVLGLYEHPEEYDNTDADGIAAVIVNENLDKTVSENVVFSVVFNFRGYDTLGESFILIAAIAGSLVVLRRSGTKRQPPKPDGEEGPQ